MTEPTPPLPEKDFIHEEYSKNPFPFWIWLTLLTVLASLVWGTGSWYLATMKKQIVQNPFLQVTNREFSLFLWQNPEFMRVNVSTKTGYLPDFQYLNGRVTPEPESADRFVSAPPEILFLYHTWHRLLAGEMIPRPILVGDLQEFLNYDEEWLPKYWWKAPEGYVKLINQDLPDFKDKSVDLQSLPKDILPPEVRLAFQGWKNYYKEGEKIDKVKPTFSQMQKFLDRYPNYARNYWRNIVLKTTPAYLQTNTLGKFKPEDIVPGDEMTSFLKVAFYNYQQSLNP